MDAEMRRNEFRRWKWKVALFVALVLVIMGVCFGLEKNSRRAWSSQDFCIFVRGGLKMDAADVSVGSGVVTWADKNGKSWGSTDATYVIGKCSDLDVVGITAVSTTNYPKVIVEGAVWKGGVLEANTLAWALAIAAPQTDADLRRIVVTKSGGQRIAADWIAFREGDYKQNVSLDDGDVVSIPQRSEGIPWRKGAKDEGTQERGKGAKGDADKKRSE